MCIGCNGSSDRFQPTKRHKVNIVQSIAVLVNCVTITVSHRPRSIADAGLYEVVAECSVIRLRFDF